MTDQFYLFWWLIHRLMVVVDLLSDWSLWIRKGLIVGLMIVGSRLRLNSRSWVCSMLIRLNGGVLILVILLVFLMLDLLLSSRRLMWQAVGNLIRPTRVSLLLQILRLFILEMNSIRVLIIRFDAWDIWNTWILEYTLLVLSLHWLDWHL